MQRLAREKICLQERLASLKVELSRLNIEVDLDHWKVDADEQDSNSTSTATGKGQSHRIMTAANTVNFYETSRLILAFCVKIFSIYRKTKNSYDAENQYTANIYFTVW